MQDPFTDCTGIVEHVPSKPPTPLRHIVFSLEICYLVHDAQKNMLSNERGRQQVVRGTQLRG